MPMDSQGNIFIGSTRLQVHESRRAEASIVSPVFVSKQATRLAVHYRLAGPGTANDYGSPTVIWHYMRLARYVEPVLIPLKTIRHNFLPALSLLVDASNWLDASCTKTIALKDASQVIFIDVTDGQFIKRIWHY